MNLRAFLPVGGVVLALLPAFSALRAETPGLLHEAMGNWLAGKGDWALTQRVRTLSDDGRVKEERLERFDPSRPDDQRWHLLEVDGKAPTEAQRQALERRKNLKPRKQGTKSLEDLLDITQAVRTTETPLAVTYAIPVRPGAALLAQTDKLIVLVTVGRESRAIERVTAALSDPMRIALGLAKVSGVDLDLSFDPAAEDPKSPADEGQASGTARITMSKLGVPMEYEWSDFKRVTTYPGPAK